MPKIIFSIFKIGDEYRAVIKIGQNAEPTASGRIVYQDGEEVGDDPIEPKILIRGPIREMKEKAKKWAREQRLPFVHNIDFNPYE
jgi:hypothetical protein